VQPREKSSAFSWTSSVLLPISRVYQGCNALNSLCSSRVELRLPINNRGTERQLRRSSKHRVDQRIESPCHQVGEDNVRCYDLEHRTVIQTARG
jgi:hypothetical protein